MTAPAWQEFASPAELAEALATAVAGRLADAIAERGAATLAVSGGTTPARFFAALSGHELDWAKVTVTLVDERFVPPDSPRSNERLVREKLLTAKAGDARFISFVQPLIPPPLKGEGVAKVAESPSPLRGGGTASGMPDDAARSAALALSSLALPFDVVVLGMGGDGHTASFFPDAENLDALLDPATTALVQPVSAASAGEPRLTLTLPPIAGARFLAVHIEGAGKRQVFENAMATGTPPLLPIRRVLDAAATAPQIFWAPSQG